LPSWKQHERLLPWGAIPIAGIQELQSLIGGCIAINPHDLSGSADAIHALLTDHSKRKRLGSIAYDHFLRRFTRRTMVLAYLRLLALPACVDGPMGVRA